MMKSADRAQVVYIISVSLLVSLGFLQSTSPLVDAFQPTASRLHTSGLTISESIGAGASSSIKQHTSRLHAVEDVDTLSPTTMAETTGFFDILLHNPVFWSFNVMLLIVALLTSWESFVEYAKEKTPAAIVPVIDNILGEMGGLGFIGLVLSAALNEQFGLGSLVGSLSEQFLGEKEILMESFEFLHETFFQTAMVFFATTAFIIARVLWSFQAIVELADDVGDDAQEATPSGEVSCEVAGILNAPSIQKASIIGQFLEEDHPSNQFDLDQAYMKECDVGQNPFWRELALTPKERGAEALVIRERLKREFGLPEEFKIHTYLENVFASTKLDVVEISPLSWLPLIPAIALANAVDLTHDVVSPMAANAADSSGYFLSTPWFFYPKAAIEALSLGWGVHNFWKIANIKSMLVPKVVRLEGEIEGLGRLLPPSIESPELRRDFHAQSTPVWVRSLEQLYAAPPKNRVEELFGVVGGNGLSFYLKSIKFHTWLVVTSLVVFTSHILPRDIYALMHQDSVHIGDPKHLVPEILIFSAFAVINVIQLAYQPTTFLNYCLITCVEDNVTAADLKGAIQGEGGVGDSRISNGQE